MLFKEQRWNVVVDKEDRRSSEKFKVDADGSVTVVLAAHFGRREPIASHDNFGVEYPVDVVIACERPQDWQSVT